MIKTNRARKNPRSGGSFDEFLKEQGIFEAVQATALKRTLVTQISEVMKEHSLTKFEMVRRMRTSHAQLDRLLDSEDGSVELETLCGVAAVVGRRVRLELV